MIGAATTAVLFVVAAPAPSAPQASGVVRTPHRVANPAIRRFADAITFLASFDDDLPNAELAAGKGKPRAVSGTPQFAPGRFGRALAGGTVTYHAEGNIDLTRPGSALFWISPRVWKYTDDEPYLFALRVGTQHGLVMVARQGRMRKPRRKATYYVYAKTGPTPPTSIHIGQAAAWKPGVWHLLVLNWRPGSVELSIDGSRPARKQTPDWPAAGWFMVGFGKPNPKATILIDDLMVLDRPLSPDEIKDVYDESTKDRAE